jgi:integrase
MGNVRLGEITTPLVDKVVRSINRKVSPATAKSCRSVVSGVLGLAVRHGALTHNPVREIERIESRPRRAPRALTAEERVELIRQLQDDVVACRRDLPDLVFFMLATGVRIGEALAVLWCQVDWTAGTVEITSTLVRVRHEGLLRKSTKPGRGAGARPSALGGGDAAAKVHDRRPAGPAIVPRRTRRVPRPGQRAA